ncbi:MAG: parallel beta-helix domain-containing protein [Chitinophagaceae bacterium]
MKKSINLLGICLAIIVAIFFSSCKKDLSSVNKGDTLLNNDAAIAEKSKFSDFVVHSGGSIQAMVDAAKPGAVIKIEPGVYNEDVTVNKPGIKLMGLSKNGQGVIIQNPGDEENGITVLDNGDGFVLMNVTVKNFKENGVFLSHVDNFLLSRVTTINNGEYGLFPVFCNNEKIDHCTATGHTDTGIYVGQSTNVTVSENEAYANVNGLEIENCTNIEVFKNNSYDNVAGILVVLLPGLTIKTSSNITLTNNYVHDNNHVNFAEPGGGFEAFVPSGSGILIVGTDKTTAKNNKVSGNNFTGIATVSTLVLGLIAGIPAGAFADIEPNPDGAIIEKNELSNNGTAVPAGLPFPGVDLLWDGSGNNNCWSKNKYTSSYPCCIT